MQHFFSDFEITHQFYYRSDLREYIFESNIEDFIANDDKSVFVSTIHKAKGREFDNVYLMSAIPNGRNVDDMRSYYVGLTRAKRNLYMVTNPPTEYSSISIALNMHDESINIIALSASGKDKLKAWTDKGYEVTSAKVSYTLAWKPQDSDVEYAVCLANVVISKNGNSTEEIRLNNTAL